MPSNADSNSFRESQIARERSFQPGAPDYFENVFLCYREPIESKKYSVAIDRCLALFEKYRATSPDIFSGQHKGRPFYVMGYAAFASHDYPTASLMFDAAVDEDIRSFGVATDKPALLFMRLEDKNQAVLASKIIQDIINTANELINDYNSRLGHALIDLDGLRRLFLTPIVSSNDVHKRPLVTAFISFIAEWKYRVRLIRLVENGPREPFFLHIFRGCLLFESIIKENTVKPIPPPTRSGVHPLGRALQHVSRELAIPDEFPIRPKTFDAEVASLTPYTSTTDAIQMTGKSATPWRIILRGRQVRSTSRHITC